MKKESLIYHGAINVSLYVLKAQYIVTLIYLICYPHAITSINRAVGYALIAVQIVSVIYSVIDSIVNNEVNCTLLTICGIVLALLSTDVRIRDVNMALQNITGFIFIISFMEMQKNIKPDKELSKFIARIVLISSVVFLVYSRMPFAYNVETQDLYLEKTALTLGYSNPNGIAMLLLFFLIMVLIFARNKQFKKGTAIALCVEYLYLIYQTKSRAVLVAAVFLLIMNMVTVKNIPKWMFWFSVGVPLVSITLLPYLKDIGFMDGQDFLGKALYSVREKMFRQRLDYLRDALDWAFGNIGRGLFKNHHNGFLSILLSSGICGVAVFVYSLAKNALVYFRGMNRTSYMAVCGILAVLLHSSAEAGFVVGAVPYSIGLITLLIYIRFEEEEHEAPAH